MAYKSQLFGTLLILCVATPFAPSTLAFLFFPEHQAAFTLGPLLIGAASVWNVLLPSTGLTQSLNGGLKHFLNVTFSQRSSQITRFKIKPPCFGTPGPPLTCSNFVPIPILQSLNILCSYLIWLSSAFALHPHCLE